MQPPVGDAPAAATEMSISRVVSRLSAMPVVVDRRLIPTFGRTALPALDAPRVGVLWRDIAASAADSSRAGDLPVLEAAHFADKRLVVFGEQHQQSQVLKAQLLAMSFYASESARLRRRLHVVLEHFNFQQDDLLLRFASRAIGEAELLGAYAEAREGFDLRHYLPLLQLARELGLVVSGGFPPRQWAAAVNRQGVDAARQHYASETPADFDAARWGEQVCTIAEKQVSYLESMMGDRPATMPCQTPLPALPSGGSFYQSTISTTTAGAAGQSEARRGYFTKGLFPAQALKDTFFAHATDKLLAQEPPVNVLAVCGLGHSEFGIGLLERLHTLRSVGSDHAVDDADVAGDRTGTTGTGAGRKPGNTIKRSEVLLIASKDSASGEYLSGDGTPPNAPADPECEDILADLVVPYEADE